MEPEDKLKLIKQLSGLSQEELARQVGISFVALNALINGRAKPHKSTAATIDELYLKYSGEKSISETVLNAKRNIIAIKSKKYKNVLQHIISRKDLLDEIILKLTYHTNRIEGSTLSENETAAVLFDGAILPNKTQAEQMEAKNHQTAIKYLFDYLVDDGNVNEKLLLKLHSILLNSIHPEAGIYRQHGVRIMGTNLPTANYLSVPKLMKNLMANISNIGANNTIAYAAKTHAQFEQIHPFADGNGRIGRLIIQAILLRNNLVPAIIDQKDKPLYLRYLYVAQTRDDYSLLENFLSDTVLRGYEIINSGK